MDRTPIKIPGKNTRDSSKAAVAARKALNRPRGRPLKLTTSTKLPQSSPPQTEATNKGKTRSLKNIKSRRKMSNLEKLPTELLVDIFLYSMNIDLPRSSPVISGKLTSELVYTQTIIAAFGPTWEEGYGNVVPEFYHLSGFPPETVPQAPGIGVGNLQSAILRCRWASLPVLQISQQVWIDTHCKERPFQPLPFLVHYDDEVERKLQKDRLEKELTPALYFEEDFALFSSYVRRQHTGGSVSHQWDTYFDVAKDLEIPQSLLLGPWNEEKTRFLYWLVKGGARFDWLNSTSGEAAMLGLKTAITDGDLRVIHLLNWAGLQERVDIETLAWAIKNAGTNRFDAVEEIFYMLDKSHNMSLLEQSIINKALAEMKDQAMVESDQETVAFVKEVKELLKVTE